jgi:hypothetical protein
MLLDDKVKSESYSLEVLDIMASAPTEASVVRLLLLTSLSEVSFLRNAVPDAWKLLSADFRFDFEDFNGFQAFVQSLASKGWGWYRESDLYELFSQFAQRNSLPPIAGDQFSHMLDFYSAEPEQTLKWGVPFPFTRLREWFVYWRGLDEAEGIVILERMSVASRSKLQGLVIHSPVLLSKPEKIQQTVFVPPNGLR